MTSIPPPPRTAVGMGLAAFIGGGAVWGLTNLPPDAPRWLHFALGFALAGAAAWWGVYQDKPR